MVTELVSVKIAFHPDEGGGEQTTVAREFVIDARHHDEVLSLFRQFCDAVQFGHTVDAKGQLGIFGDDNERLPDGGEKEER